MDAQWTDQVGTVWADEPLADLPKALTLELEVREPEVIAELCKFPDGASRDAFALSALRLGVLALRQASGAIDSAMVKHEGERLLGSIGELLNSNLTQTTNVLQKYFDPHEGDLPQRLQRLLCENGELEKLLSRHLDADDSTIAKTLAQHLGEQSPLFQMLSPSQTDGILASMSQALATALQAQREHILGQFSLDNKESALSRLVAELRDVNGSLRQNLLQVIEDLSKKNQDFQSDVRTTLESFKARREEAARSTTHGIDFEKAVESMLAPLAQRWGDVFEDTTHKTGSKSYCKAGDHVITLGPESAAPNARIVIEAKEDRSYDAAKARAEIHEARENRKAQIGVFVFSKMTVPLEMEPFLRFGPDILVVWDRDDANTDVFLKAAISLARALVVRERAYDERVKADLSQVGVVIQVMTKDMEILADVLTWAGTIKNNSQKILDKVEKVRDNLDKQVETLREHLAAIGQDGREKIPAEGFKTAP
jgi:hypothetical protein